MAANLEQSGDEKLRALEDQDVSRVRAGHRRRPVRRFDPLRIRPVTLLGVSGPSEATFPLTPQREGQGEAEERLRPQGYALAPEPFNSSTL